MSLVTAIVVNGVLAAVVVTALALVLRFPYLLDRVAREKEFLSGSEEPTQPETEYGWIEAGPRAA